MNKKIRAVLLLPLTLVYGMVIFIRNLLFDLEIIPSHEFNIPLISVGNLAVGGTGKTPHIEYLIRLFKDNYRVAVLSRGYKRKTRGFILAEENSGPFEIGDEPCQIKRKFPDILVAVDEKRSRGIKLLLKSELAPEIILMDDAFQHRQVTPGFSILMDDFNQPASKDYLLPSGRLREPFTSKKRADIILVSKSPPSLKPIERGIRSRATKLNDNQHLYFTSMKAGELTGIFNGDLKSAPKENKSILLVSGIANPGTVKPMVKSFDNQVREMVFPDHQIYTEVDATNILNAFLSMEQDESIILTTEKDAVKIKEFEHIFLSVREKMFYFPIFVEFLNNDDKFFNAQLLNYVKSYKRNGSLHQK